MGTNDLVVKGQKMVPVLKLRVVAHVLGCLNIKGYSSFAGVKGPPQEALLRIRLVMIEGADAPGGVTTWSLNLDNIGPKVSQYLATQKSLLIGEVQDPIPAKGTFYLIFLCQMSVSLR